ncbi:MAG: vitamin B12 dependent-methionine synthase activation domain-containing protein [candidate division Zixibacteria bacterium]
MTASRQIFDIAVEATLPTQEAILAAQGIPPTAKIDAMTRQLANDALAGYVRQAAPIGLFQELTKEEFEHVYRGEGSNSDPSALPPIYAEADDLALFVATVGQQICSEIENLMSRDDYASSVMLDAAASEGADNTAAMIEASYRESLAIKNSDNVTMRFSPGYCGWHVSGQKKLFDKINPGEIGISLSESSLMAPLKSISGVVISGSPEIFDFGENFEFCSQCKNHSCRERFEALARQ